MQIDPKTRITAEAALQHPWFQQALKQSQTPETLDLFPVIRDAFDQEKFMRVENLLNTDVRKGSTAESSSNNSIATSGFGGSAKQSCDDLTAMALD
jgi:hypothetical protein